MKQGIDGPKKTIFFLLFIFMLVFQANFARADEWEDAGFSTVKDQKIGDGFGVMMSEAQLWQKVGGLGSMDGFTDASEAKLWKLAEYEPYEAYMWKLAGCNTDEAKTWKLGGYNAHGAATLKGFFSSPDKAKMFTAKYCKNGFAMAENGPLPIPPNYNDDDGSHCYLFFGKVFQLLGDNQALYKRAYDSGPSQQNLYFVSFGKGGRAVSEIAAVVTVKGGYKYQSLAGIKIVPELRVLKQ